MMPPRPFPRRPNLDQLKRQAKELLRSAQERDPAALARFRTLPAFARSSTDAIAVSSLALHDAQSVIAREHGFDSWKALRERVEELTLGFGAAVDEFIEAATDGRSDRAERLLAMHPGIAGANFQTALVLGDLDSVEARLARDPALAHQPGGPRGWEPLLYVCHNSLPRGTANLDGLVAVARRLIEAGADPNTRFPWVHHGVRRPVLWGATFVTRLLPLSELLLESGADPNDGVTFTLAAGAGDLNALELLQAHGADVNQRWATDGATTLYTILNWATTPAGVHWLLDREADPEPVFEDNGETPLHVVARRWDPALAELLVNRGADVSRRRADGRTPYAVAELSGNRAVAEWLLAHGSSDELSGVDRLVAACSRGDRTAAEALLATDPTLRDQIAGEHYVGLYQAAERGDVEALETMLAYGFDPNRGDDEIGKTALHCAAAGGWPDAVRALLAHGASVAVRDREFHAQPLVWAAERARSGRKGREQYAEVARLLIAAGSPLEWESAEEPADALIEVLNEWRRAGPEARS